MKSDHKADTFHNPGRYRLARGCRRGAGGAGPSAGFTLIEVMVALVIVGTALPALMFQVLSITDNTAYLRDKALAQWVAQNKMTELRLMKQIRGDTLSGSDSGEMEMAQTQWNWKMTSEDTPLASNFKRITIFVSRGADSSPEDDTLVTLEGIMSE